jgi:hypothetical protein
MVTALWATIITTFSNSRSASVKFNVAPLSVVLNATLVYTTARDSKKQRWQTRGVFINSVAKRFLDGSKRNGRDLPEFV